MPFAPSLLVGALCLHSMVYTVALSPKKELHPALLSQHLLRYKKSGNLRERMSNRALQKQQQHKIQIERSDSYHSNYSIISWLLTNTSACWWRTLSSGHELVNLRGHLTDKVNGLWEPIQKVHQCNYFIPLQLQLKEKNWIIITIKGFARQHGAG